MHLHFFTDNNILLLLVKNASVMLLWVNSYKYIAIIGEKSMYVVIFCIFPFFLIPT